jgi:type I restriction enzyme S subunit
VNKLPAGWLWTTLGEVTASGVGQAGPGNDIFQYVDISSVDLTSKRVTAAVNLLPSEAPSRARQNVEEGDILVSLTRPNRNAVAKVTRDLAGAIASTGFHLLRSVGVEPGYIYCYVQSREFVDGLVAKVQGVVYPAVRPKDVTAMPIPLPPLAEQKRIVAEIEKQFTKLETARADLATARRRANRLMRSVLARAFRHNHPEGGQVDLSSTAPWSLTAGWRWARIGDIFDVFVGATPSRRLPEYWNGGVPWVSSGEISFCRINFTRESISELGLRNTSTVIHPPGTILLGMIGEGKTRGQCAILDIHACHNQNSAAIRVSEAKRSPEYVYYFLQYVYSMTRKIGSGNNQRALNKERVKAIRIPLPPDDQDFEIAAQLGTWSARVCRLDADLKKSELHGHLLSRAIIGSALAGQLVQQDPNDEPASLLLERIRASRAGAITVRPKRPKRNMLL